MTLALIGVAIVAIPFIGITAVAARASGWREALVCWAITLAIVAMIGIGVFLIMVGVS